MFLNVRIREKSLWEHELKLPFFGLSLDLSTLATDVAVSFPDSTAWNRDKDGEKN